LRPMPGLHPGQILPHVPARRLSVARGCGADRFGVKPFVPFRTGSFSGIPRVPMRR
jgi:hypothetical protein